MFGRQFQEQKSSGVCATCDRGTSEQPKTDVKPFVVRQSILRANRSKVSQMQDDVHDALQAAHGRRVLAEDGGEVFGKDLRRRISFWFVL